MPLICTVEQHCPAAVCRVCSGREKIRHEAKRPSVTATMCPGLACPFRRGTGMLEAGLLG